MRMLLRSSSMRMSKLDPIDEPLNKSFVATETERNKSSESRDVSRGDKGASLVFGSSSVKVLRSGTKIISFSRAKVEKRSSSSYEMKFRKVRCCSIPLG